MGKSLSLRDLWLAWRGWLHLGIGIKRWLLFLGVGAVIAGIGVAALIVYLGNKQILPDSLYSIITLQFFPTGLRIVLPFLLGGFIILLSIVLLGRTLIAPFRYPDEAVVQALQSYSQRNRGPRIVAIGGGTGLPNLLRGLKAYTSNITAVVTVADDGGSSGRLRRELGVLPPGDFRNNLAALASDEKLMTQLMQYRFTGKVYDSGDSDNGRLKGHAFGNLLLVALTGISGSFDEALAAAGRVLALQGQVLPSTLADVNLVAEISAESNEIHERVVGESEIPKYGGRIESVSLEPSNVTAYPLAVKAILQADLILIGPGSLYTSILPNLLVPEIAKAIQRTPAFKIYICNLATQTGETDNYSVDDHVTAIDRHVARVGVKPEDWADIVLANNNTSIPAETGGGNTVFVESVNVSGNRLVWFDLVDEDQPWRHDSKKLAEAVKSIGDSHMN
jgi:uncharacterized cofD-like protein